MPDYSPPDVWTPASATGGKFADINRPISGATHASALPVGKHPLQLYSLATPNGNKVTLLLEELLELGISEAEYDAWPIDILTGDQFGDGFVAVNPNSKIPALMDHSTDPPTRVFESAAILLHLANRFDRFLPNDPRTRTEALNWLFWVAGAAPFLGGGFGHFYTYAPIKIEYAIDRYAMETKRQLHLLDTRLADRAYLADAYSIADMAAWPWFGRLVQGKVYQGADTFLSAHEYPHVVRWADAIGARPAARRAVRINRMWGDEATRIPERH